MPALPPPEMVWEIAREVVLPAAGAAFVAFGFVLLLGRFVRTNFDALGAALGVAAGVWAGHRERGEPQWYPLDKLAGWEFVAVAAGVAVSASLLARLPRLPDAAGWVLRVAAAVGAAWALVPTGLVKDARWVEPAFAASVFLTGAVLELASRRAPGGGVPLAAALALCAAAGVLIHAHSGRMTDAATVFAAALGGVAVVACLGRADAGPALAAASVALPGLLLGGYHATFSDVPLASFVAAAAAPLALTPTLASRLTGWKLRALQLGLVLLPAAVAVGLAMRYEELPVE